MATGVIARYFDERGFGFLRPDGGGDDVYFHVKGFIAKVEPNVHDRVEFEIGPDPRGGRERAQNLRLI